MVSSQKMIKEYSTNISFVLKTLVIFFHLRSIFEKLVIVALFIVDWSITFLTINRVMAQESEII
jgi:hypothetical protein